MKISEFKEFERSYIDLLSKHGINGMASVCEELYEKHCDIISLDGVTSYVGYEYRKRHANFSQTDKVIREKFDIMFHKWNSTSANVVEIADEHDIIASVLLRAFALYLARGHEKAEDVVNGWLKDDNKSICPHKKLAIEINTMSYCDPFSGRIRHFQDRIRGKACENYVRDFLDANKIAHLDEERIRHEGYPLTPDFIFEMPMLLIRYKNGKVVLFRNHFINFPDNLSKDDEVFIVSWLECKGMFATEECHKEYYRRQYNSYISCFGEGIVFYHHGFVEPETPDKKVICIDKLPEIGTFEPKSMPQGQADLNPFIAARFKTEC